MKENIKKIILIVLAVLMIFSLVFASASTAFALEGEPLAQEILQTVDGFEYTVVEDKVTITGYSGEASEIEIPAEIETLPVTEIGPRAFEAKTGITEVTIPDSVISIGDNAFDGCSALLIVNLGAGVNSLGRDVFAECINLTALFVSESSAHYSSENGVLFDKIKSTLFYYPQGDSRDVYEIPSEVTSIGDGAFSGSFKLKSVVMPEGLKHIGSRAFLGCENIAALSVPDSVTSIGEYAFSGMSALGEVKLPAALVEISEAMLSQCTSLKKISLPLSIKKIGADAFSYCTALESITLPEGAEEIGEGAFTKCKALSSITLPASLKSVGKNTFATCEALSRVNFSGTEEEWQALGVSLGNAMIVYNFVYGSEPQKPDQDDQISSSVVSDKTPNNQSSKPSDSGDTSSDSVSSDPSENVESKPSQTVSKPQTDTEAPDTFIAAGENVVFFKDGVFTLSGDKNALPEAATIKCEQLSEGIAFVKVKAAVKERAAKFEVYSLSVTRGDEKINPAAAIKAEFKIPADYDANKAQIIYVSDRGGAVELKSRVNKKTGTVSAEITQTGTYVVAEMLHNTQGLSIGAVTLIIAAIVVAGLIIAYIFVYKPKHKK